MIKRIRKTSGIILSLIMLVTLVQGCSGENQKDKTTSTEKQFIYGTVGYGEASESLNPHIEYCGWYAVRYGAVETLFKFNDNMELEPWLAEKYELLDDYTVKIYLRDDVKFQNGEKMTGDKVKACIEDLVKIHDRAPDDLNIQSITADEQTIAITSKNKVTTLINYLSDPYGAIIDVEDQEYKNGKIIGTGPYIVTSSSSTGVDLVKNENYWGEKPKLDKITVKAFTDGDTMTMAMQNGEIDAAQETPYSSLNLFKNSDKYKISSKDTSRAYQLQFNFKSDIIKDLNVRKAISMAIDKEGFTKTLLNGNGSPASSAFPSNFSFGNDSVKVEPYNTHKAKEVLEQGGWKDSDGDGFVDKDGKNLTIRWLTYPSRAELPLLAENAQSTLKDIGIDVKINCTQNNKEYLKNNEYDIYASSFVTAPTGDPQYYIANNYIDTGLNNVGSYHNDEVESLTNELRSEFDINKRGELAQQIQQKVLDDYGFVYVCHLKMSLIMKSNIKNFESHSSDYYEITPDVDIE